MARLSLLLTLVLLLVHQKQAVNAFSTQTTRASTGAATTALFSSVSSPDYNGDDEDITSETTCIGMSAQPAISMTSTAKRNEEEKTNVILQAFWSLSPAELVFALGMLLMLATMTPLSSSASAGNIEKGQVLFDSNCASCHRGGQNIIRPSKTLQETDLVQNLGNSSPSTLQAFFTKSMQHKLLVFPNVEGGKLSETDIVDVTSFISGQAQADSW